MNVVNELLGVVGNDEQDDGGGYMRVSETREGGDLEGKDLWED